MSKGWLKKGFTSFIRWFSGDFILERRLDRYIWFCLFGFALFCIIITWSLYVEDRMVAVERNARTIESLEIHLHQKSIELVSIDERSRIENMLQQYRSPVKPPVKPAVRLKTD